MNKVETLINEIKKVDKFKNHIIFFMMNKYGFILGKDVDKLEKLENIKDIDFDKGTLQNVKALRYKVFDPNNIQPFNSILIEGEKPASVNVQKDYIIEEEFKLD